MVCRGYDATFEPNVNLYEESLGNSWREDDSAVRAESSEPLDLRELHSLRPSASARTTDTGEVQRKILVECPGVAMEDIELDDESLSAGFQLAITKRAQIDEQADNIRQVDGWPLRQQQGRWERAFLVDLTDGKFEDPVMDLRQDGILEIIMKKKQKKGTARLGCKSGRPGPAAAPSESAVSESWDVVSSQGKDKQESPEQLSTAGV